jgi:hypothetical protein
VVPLPRRMAGRVGVWRTVGQCGRLDGIGGEGSGRTGPRGHVRHAASDEYNGRASGRKMGWHRIELRRIELRRIELRRIGIGWNRVEWATVSNMVGLRRTVGHYIVPCHVASATLVLRSIREWNDVPYRPTRFLPLSYGVRGCYSLKSVFISTLYHDPPCEPVLRTTGSSQSLGECYRSENAIARKMLRAELGRLLGC